MKQQVEPLSAFLLAIGKDPRIGPIHIALFTVLYNQWVTQFYPSAIHIVSYEIMPLAKIASRVTFHKTIKELDAYGYLRYEPRFNRKGSQVYFEK